MAALVGGDLGEHRTQAHFEEARDRRRDFDATEIQAVGALQLKDQLALNVIKSGQHSGHRLTVQGNEVARRGQGTANRRFRLMDYKPVDGAILKRTLSGETLLLSVINRLIDGADFPLPYHGEVRQAFLNGPLGRRRTPVKACLVEIRGEVTGLLLNLLELTAIKLEFGDGHSRDYSETEPDGSGCVPASNRDNR